MAHGIDGESLDFGVLGAYFGGAALVFTGAFIAARRGISRRLSETALFSMGCIFSNTVLLGIPLVLTAFGERGLLVIMMIIAFHSTLLLGGTTVLIELGEGGTGHWHALAQTFRALVANPIILSVLFGLAWGIGHLPVPGLVDRFAGLLGGAVAPCALFALGAAMAQPPLPHVQFLAGVESQETGAEAERLRQ